MIIKVDYSQKRNSKQLQDNKDFSKFLYEFYLRDQFVISYNFFSLGSIYITGPESAAEISLFTTIFNYILMNID